MPKLVPRYILHCHAQPKHIEPVVRVFPGQVLSADREEFYGRITRILHHKRDLLFLTGALFSGARGTTKSRRASTCRAFGKRGRPAMI